MSLLWLTMKAVHFCYSEWTSGFPSVTIKMQTSTWAGWKFDAMQQGNDLNAWLRKHDTKRKEVHSKMQYDQKVVVPEPKACGLGSAALLFGLF